MKHIAFGFYSNGKFEPSQQGFGSVLLKALLGNISYLPAAATGGKFVFPLCLIVMCMWVEVHACASTFL